MTFADALGRWRLAILGATAVAAAWLATSAASVGIEHDNQSLQTRDADASALYRRFVATFGSDEDLLVAVGHPALVSEDGLALVGDLTRRIEAMDGVRRVWSLATAEEIVAGDLGAEPRPLLPQDAGAPDFEARVRAALDRNPDFTGWLVSADRRVAGLVVELEDRPGDHEYRSRVIEGLRGLGADVAAQGGELHLTGVPVQKHDVSDYVDRDQRVLMPAAVAILGAVLFAFYRSLWGVALPLGVAAMTVVATLGAYGLAGHDLNAITSLLPPVLLVVAVASCVHLYDAWQANDGAVARALGLVALPAALCAVTTGQGFASLSVGDIPAVGQFGLFAALGTGVAFVLTMTAAPALLTFATPPAAARRRHAATERLLARTTALATERPGAVLASAALATAALACGIAMVRSNTDLVGFLKPNAPLRIDTAWIDRHLAGSLPFDFLIEREDGRSLASLDFVRRLAALEEAVLAQPGVTDATSVLALLRQVHRAESGGEALALPDEEATLFGELDLLDESGHALVRRFVAPEWKSIRFTVRVHSIGSAASAPLVEAIRADAARLLGPGVAFRPTGALWHVVHDSERLVAVQVRSFAVAIVLVVASIGLLLRSLRFTLLAMIPNLMPILWTGGLMGYAGIDLSTGTAMIASAVLGIVVDDTIHYLAYYRRVYRGDAVAAVRETTAHVGAPVTVASLSLMLGFWVGALGSFQPTVHFSLLTGLTMVMGVVCDLLVLPASLVWMDRRSHAAT